MIARCLILAVVATTFTACNSSATPVPTRLSSQASIEQASIEQASIEQASIEQASIEQDSTELDSTEPGSIEQDSIERGSIKFGPREKVGRLQSALIDESSGLARSLRYPGKFWTHNDNGTRPGLFLIDSAGNLLATVQIANSTFRDWEAMDSVELDGTKYLVVANVGDNAARHDSCEVLVIEEPILPLPTDETERMDTKKKPLETTVRAAHTIEFTYPDGANDCEAMAVDAATRTIFFISKSGMAGQEFETMLHSIPWPTNSTDPGSTAPPRVATRIESRFNEPLVTGMNFSPDNRMAVVRTYLTAWIFLRAEGQSWADAFSGLPASRTLLPLQRQGEAICFTHDNGAFIITSEGPHTPLWRIGIFVTRNSR